MTRLPSEWTLNPAHQMTVSTRTANSRLDRGPAAATRIRCSGEAAKKEPFSGARAAVSLSGTRPCSSPRILQYPPTGNQEIWYVVPARVKPTSFRPQPSENTSTWIPTALAARKWPSSCTKIMMPKPSTPNNMVRIIIYAILGSRFRPSVSS